MKKTFGILLLLLIVAFASVPASDILKEKNAQKAGYTLLEAYKWKIENDFTSFSDLVQRAYELNPDNTSIGFAASLAHIVSADSAETELALTMARRHIDAHPADVYDNMLYVDFCRRLGKNDQAIEVMERLVKNVPGKMQLRYNLAELYAKTGHFAEAVAVCDTIQKIDGNSDQITVHKINLFFMLRDTASAFTEGRRLFYEKPNRLTSNEIMGQLHLQTGNPDSALYYFDRMITLDPNSVSGYYAKAGYYKSIGDSEKYFELIGKTLRGEGLELDDKLELMQEIIRHGMGVNEGGIDVNGEVLEDTTAVEEVKMPQPIDDLFAYLLEKYSHEPKLRTLYSEYLARKGDYSGAAEQISYELDLNPTQDSKRWILLMQLYGAAEEYQKAINAGEKALEFASDDPEIYNRIAGTYQMMEKPDSALAVYNRALEKVDTTKKLVRGALMGGLADVYLQLKDTVSALKYYQKAYRLIPDSPGLLNNYAYALSEAGKDLDLADNMSAKTIKAVPDSPIYLDTYAWIQFKRGEYRLAKIYMERALSLEEEPNAVYYEHYGDILFMCGEPEAALKQWEKAAELDPTSELLQRKIKNKTYFYK